MSFNIRVCWLLPIVLLTAFWEFGDASLATMSIDLGSQFIKAGIVKSGVPMEIVLNKESKRKSPNAIFLRNGERSFSDAALGMQIRYPAHVYTHFLDLLGKPLDHPSVANFKANFPNIQFQRAENSTAVVFKVGDQLYSTEMMLAMVLSHVKDFAQAHAEQPVHDVVITVPAYFTQTERLIVEQAAEIAGFNLLQLMNDGSAAALSHGVFRRKEITEKPQRLLVYDAGAAKITATLVEFRTVKRDKITEPEMFILGVGFDRTLGGFELTRRLRNYLAKKFNEQYTPKQKIEENPRSMAKLLKEAERVKQVLSANTDTLVQIESVHEEKDMRIKLNREEFNRLYDDLNSRFTDPIAQTLKIAQLSLDEIDQIVFMGGGSRVPKVQEIVQEFVKPKTIGKFLNTDEAIAMGALFQSAHLSKGFKVKPFRVNELVLFPVEVDFVSKNVDESGETVMKNLSRTIFPYRGNYPTNKKSLSLTSYTSDFSITWKFGDLSTHFSEKQLEEFGELVNSAEIKVTGLAKALEENLKEDSEYKGVKIGFQLDASGIVRIGKAELAIEKKKGVIGSITNTISGLFSSSKSEDVEESADGEEAVKKQTDESQETEEKEKEQAKEEKEETEKEKEQGGEKDKGNKKANATTEKETKSSDAKKKADEKAASKKTVDLKKLQLKTSVGLNGNSPLPTVNDIRNAKKILSEFARLEKEQAEKHRLHNELESLAFEAKNLLDEEEMAPFISKDEKSNLLKESTSTRDWLEETPEPELTFEELKKRLNTLKDLVRPIKKRTKEAKDLPKTLDNLNKLIDSSQALVNMGLNPKDDANPLFNKNDSEAFNAKLEKLKSWLKEQQAAQEKKAKHENPTLTVNQLEGKIKALDKEIKSFMKKMRNDRIVEMSEQELASGDAQKKLKDKLKDKEKSEDSKKTEL